MQEQVALFPLFVTFVVLLIVGTFWFHSYTGLRREKAYLALVASVIGGGLRGFYRFKAIRHFASSESEMDVVLTIIASGALIVFLTAFALRLWGRWIGESATPAERQPGVPGIRAWFCASNVTVGTALVLCAWQGDDLSPLLGIVVVAGLLAAYPFLRMESPVLAAVPSAPEDLSPEREKIVSMLEAGKLTPEESAELLQALGESARRPSRQVPLTSGQRLLLIGATLVTVGFFLPWFVVNPGREMDRMMMQFPSALMRLPSGNGFGQAASLPVPVGQIQTASVNIGAGDIQHGMGWAALALAVAAALLPYVATTLDPATQRTARLLCLGVGSIIVLYLLTQNLRFVGLGLIIAIGGYVVEVAGALRPEKTMSS